MKVSKWLTISSVKILFVVMSIRSRQTTMPENFYLTLKEDPHRLASRRCGNVCSLESC
jgi:hypothetical protein